MDIFRRFIYYKRALQVLFFFNVLFFFLGCVAFWSYTQTHDWSAASLAFAGLGTLICGIILPYTIINHMAHIAHEYRIHTERVVAHWVSGWLQNYENHKDNDDPMRSPQFWINIGLLTMEVFGEHSRHPVARVFAEFAPLLKLEMQRRQVETASRPSHQRKSRKSA
ncbi:MAG: hypothetical protein IT289_09320 [Oligoflexia bacterium]|nr:hypothetical protein [Oligoflexia bacterium]